METELLQALSDLKGRWMIGGSAFDKTPESWRAAIAEDPSSELALVALAGQAMQFAVRATPGTKLTSLPPLPQLGLPTPPEQARQQIRNLIRVIKLHESQISTVIHLLAARGYVLHPTDYMPRRFDQLPGVYAAWAAWQQADKASDESPAHETINSENWDEWMPAERRLALSHLRRDQPDVARELISAKVPSLPAEERLRIFEMLGETLSSEDQSLLEGFAKDRSGKVQDLIRQFLARLGTVNDDATELAEYVEFFSVAKKRRDGGYTITANKLKTKPQRKRRAELAARMSLKSFVSGLNLQHDSELIDGWEHVNEQASEELVQMVAMTGSEQTAFALAMRIASLEGISPEVFGRLFDRLGTESRRELLPRVLKNDRADLTASVACAEGLWGEITLEQLKSLPAVNELKKIAAEDHSKRTVRLETLRQGLFSLGLLADQVAATELLKLFSDSNLFASDPMLGLLKLNACLPQGTLE